MAQTPADTHTPGPGQSEFDSYSSHYEQALAQGISVSGEDASYFAAGRLKWLAKRLKQLKFSAQSVLDFGCGVGNSLPLLREQLGANRIAGIDVSAESIAVARRRLVDQDFELATPDQLPPQGLFDLAFCNGVFHHIPLEQRIRSLQLVASHLRPGGLFALFENNPLNPGTRYVMSKIPFDRDAITLLPWETRRLMRQAGFEILRTDYMFYFPRPLSALRPCEPMLCRLPLGAQYMVLGQKSLTAS